MIKASLRVNERNLALGLCLLIVFCLLTEACTCSVSSETLEFQRGEFEAQKGEYKAALVHYKNVVDKYIKTPLAIQAAIEAARINHYQLKNAKDAIALYKHIILNSSETNRRFDAQKHLADLHFTLTLDYTQAITEYSRLLELPHSSSDDLQIRMALARSHFYLSNFFQTQVEVDALLAKNFEKEQLFDALLLKANALLSGKKVDEATLILKQLMADYPERSRAEAIGLVLALTYEEQKNFTKAIETLESIKDTYSKKSFIENRIKVLKERQSYLPGARGWKK